jgi:hypothetical protein
LRNAPVGLADVARGGKKIDRFAGLNALFALRTRVEERCDVAAEFVDECTQKFKRRGR